MERPRPRPFAAPEGTWPEDEWPLDVQQTDETGDVDLSLIRYHLSLTPAERLTRLEEFAEFILTARRANGIRAWSGSENS